MKHPGYRLTPQRAAIIAFLEGNDFHPSAEDIYEAVLEIYPMISMVTVYNTLEALKMMGRVTELVNIDRERRRFDPKMKPHHHLMCVRCRRILDVEEDYSNLEVPERQGFEIISVQVLFKGTCPECHALGADCVG